MINSVDENEKEKQKRRSMYMRHHSIVMKNLEPIKKPVSLLELRLENDLPFRIRSVRGSLQ